METRKLQALAHHIIAGCDPKQLGAIRLNKIIWFTDVIAYQTNFRSFTGEVYVKRQHGPVPKRILVALRELEEAGKISIKEPEYHYEVRQYQSLRAPDPEDLTSYEKRVAHDVKDAVLGYTANEVSDITHDSIWSAASLGDEIPMCATLVAKNNEVTQEICDWASRVCNERNV